VPTHEANAQQKRHPGNRPEPLASAAAVAEVLGVPEKTLAEWRSQGKGPEYHKIGRYVRYDWADVRAWLAQRRTAVGAA